LANLRDGRARICINARIRRLLVSNPGDGKPVGGGVSEMRIDYGPGYRVYFVRRGEALVILVAGGDKHNRRGDLVRAARPPQTSNTESHAAFSRLANLDSQTIALQCTFSPAAVRFIKVLTTRGFLDL
jgi:putative addiction module killer protein